MLSEVERKFVDDTEVQLRKTLEQQLRKKETAPLPEYALSPSRSQRRKLAHDFTLKPTNLMKKRAAHGRAIRVGVPLASCDRSKLSVTNVNAVVVHCCEKGLKLGLAEGVMKGYYAPSTVILKHDTVPGTQDLGKVLDQFNSGRLLLNLTERQACCFQSGKIGDASSLGSFSVNVPKTNVVIHLNVNAWLLVENLIRAVIEGRQTGIAQTVIDE